MTNSPLKISLELLYHYNCSTCRRWWSVADIQPTSGQPVWCPHCGTHHQVPDRVMLGNGSSQPFKTLADEANEVVSNSAIALHQIAASFPNERLLRLFTDEQWTQAAAQLKEEAEHDIQVKMGTEEDSLQPSNQ